MGFSRFLQGFLDALTGHFDLLNCLLLCDVVRRFALFYKNEVQD
jgi:hypothetical protein